MKESLGIFYISAMLQRIQPLLGVFTPRWAAKCSQNEKWRGFCLLNTKSIPKVSMELCCLPPNYTFISIQHRLCTAVLKADVLAVVIRCFFSTMNTTRLRWFFAGKTEKAFWEFEQIVIGGRFNIFFFSFPRQLLSLLFSRQWSRVVCSSPASTTPAVLLNRPHQAQHRYWTIVQNLASIWCQHSSRFITSLSLKKKNKKKQPSHPEKKAFPKTTEVSKSEVAHMDVCCTGEAFKGPVYLIITAVTHTHAHTG